MSTKQQVSSKNLSSDIIQSIELCSNSNLGQICKTNKVEDTISNSIYSGGDDIQNEIEEEESQDHDIIKEDPVFLDKYYDTQVHQIDGETLTETQLMQMI